MPRPDRQVDIVVEPTCLVRKSASISFGGFLAERDSAFSDRCLCLEKHRVDVFHSTEPSSAAKSNASCGVHPHTDLNFHSPILENALQAKHLGSRTHQSIILCFTRSQSNHSLSSAIRANGTVTEQQCTTRNTLPGSDAASMVCVAPSLCAHDSLWPSEQPDKPRMHSEKLR